MHLVGFHYKNELTYISTPTVCLHGGKEKLHIFHAYLKNKGDNFNS
jgi:hypothetical protein